jgi:putative PIN family toxin of toxin-antitoxin system
MFVVDANIILAGLRSRNGASFQILSKMIEGSLEFVLSTAITLEYEDLLKRQEIKSVLNWMKNDDIDLLLDTLIMQSILVTPWFRYRPFLDDPKDDIYIECAMAVGGSQLISFDKGFRNPDVKAFGIELVSPKQVLGRLNEGV